MKKVEFTIKTLSPLSHGAFSEGCDTGNAMLFRRLTVVAPSGRTVSVPAVSGNSLRGVMRRFLARELFTRLGLAGKADALYIAVANGGAIGKSLDSYIYPQKVAAVRELVPPLSAFGAALYSYLLPGAANVSFAVLKCAEAGTGSLRIADLTEDLGFARHVDRTEVLTPEDIKPMPYTVETVASGAEFSCSVSFAAWATGLDIACVFHALNGVSHLGGKSGSGFGQVELSQTFDDSAYAEWLESRDDAYAGKLEAFSAELLK